MSVFSKFLAASISEGSTSAIVRDCKSLFILEEERGLYDFALSHVNRYGQLPSVDTLNAKGFRVPTATESPSYYLDSLRQRYIYNTINDRHPRLRSALQGRDGDAAISVLREMIDISQAASSYEGVTSLAAEAMLLVDHVTQRRYTSGLVGVPSGWPTLDNATLGFMGGDLIVLAGRPSLGKSWLLMESAFQAWQAGKSILFVTMEMSTMQICQRWVGRHIGINPNYIQSGKLSTWFHEDIRDYAQAVSTMPRCHFVAGNVQKTVGGVEAAISQYLPDIVYVDAAYLLSPTAIRGGGVAKWEIISRVLGELKSVAIRYDRPIFLTVQFSRNVKSKQASEPDLGDIAGSDSIPQDASVVLGIQRGTPPFEDTQRKVSIMKNRSGMDGVFHTNLRFTPPDMSEVLFEDVRTDWDA